MPLSMREGGRLLIVLRCDSGHDRVDGLGVYCMGCRVAIFGCFVGDVGRIITSI